MTTASTLRATACIASGAMTSIIRNDANQPPNLTLSAIRRIGVLLTRESARITVVVALVLAYAASATVAPIQAQQTDLDRTSESKKAAVLLSTYVGSAETSDEITSVRADRHGNVVLTGNGSPSGIQPAVVNTIGPGEGNPWIAKLDASGSAVFVTYLGGTGRDWIWDVDIDAADNIYAIGVTESPDFPIVRPPEPFVPFRFVSMFIAKISPDGSQLIYTASLGYYSNAVYPRIAVTPDGVACFAADADDDLLVPFVNAIDTSILFGADVLVGRIDAAGDRFDYITALGGDAYERAWDIAVDPAGSAYVVGSMTIGVDWPTVNPPMDVPSNTTSKGFIAKLSPDGSHLVYSSMLGGQPSAGAYGIAVDEEGQAYVVGTGLNGGQITFPVTTYLDSFNSNNAFSYVMKIPAEGGRVLWTTAVVGDSHTSFTRVALDETGAVYAAGKTSTTRIPLVAAFQQSVALLGGFVQYEDLVIAKLSPSGSTLKLCTYYGGGGEEDVGRITIDPIGVVRVCGLTTSHDLPLTNPWEPLPDDPPDLTNGFLLAFRTNQPPRVASIAAVERPGKPLRVVIRGSGLDPDLKVYIGESLEPWAGVAASRSKAVLKGVGLDELFPVGQPVTMRIVNSAGAGLFATYTRS